MATAMVGASRSGKTIRLRRKGWDLIGTVESDSQYLTEYEVRRSPDGTVGCACMGWAFSKATPKTCKHMRAWSAADAAGMRFAKVVPASEPVTYKEGSETFTVRRAMRLN